MVTKSRKSRDGRTDFKMHALSLCNRLVMQTFLATPASARSNNTLVYTTAAFPPQERYPGTRNLLEELVGNQGLN